MSDYTEDEIEKVLIEKMIKEVDAKWKAFKENCIIFADIIAEVISEEKQNSAELERDRITCLLWNWFRYKKAHGISFDNPMDEATVITTAIESPGYEVDDIYDALENSLKMDSDAGNGVADGTKE